MYEIIFLSNNEPYSDNHWNKLKSRFPTAIRINGIQGIHEAHQEAARRVRPPGPPPGPPACGSRRRGRPPCARCR